MPTGLLQGNRVLWLSTGLAIVSLAAALLSGLGQTSLGMMPYWLMVAAFIVLAVVSFAKRRSEVPANVATKLLKATIPVLQKECDEAGVKVRIVYIGLGIASDQSVDSESDAEAIFSQGSLATEGAATRWLHEDGGNPDDPPLDATLKRVAYQTHDALVDAVRSGGSGHTGQSVTFVVQAPDVGVFVGMRSDCKPCKSAGGKQRRNNCKDPC